MSCHKLICKRPKTTCHYELSHKQTFSITLFEGLKRSMVVRCQNLAVDGSKLKENKLDFHEKSREYSQLSSVIMQKKYEKPVSNLYDEKNVKPSMIKPKIKNYNTASIQQQHYISAYLHYHHGK